MEWTSIGARIRKQRELLGYTREAFAEKIDITPKFCSDIELGVKGMSIPTLCRIADTLCMSTDYILFGKEQRETSKSPLVMMIERCPEDKIEHLSTIIHAYMQAITKKPWNL